MRSLRLDDIGASSKRWEVYSRWRPANVGPLKWVWPFKAWGPYREMTPKELDNLFAACELHGSRMTVAVTAAWVERDGTLTPYPVKFPEQAMVIKKWADLGIVEVANHGLTHCVRGQHRPRWLQGNRRWHREFFPGMSKAEMLERVHAAQTILSRWLRKAPMTFVPPGYQFPFELAHPRVIRSALGGLVWHDRDLVAGLRYWEVFRRERFCMVRDIV